MSCGISKRFLMSDCNGAVRAIFSLEDQKIKAKLMRFADNVFDISETICDKHISVFAKPPKNYCCNPFDKSAHSSKAAICVTASMYQKGCLGKTAELFTKKIAPMDGLCRHCKDLKLLINGTGPSESECDEVIMSETTSLKKLNQILVVSGLDEIEFGRRNTVGKQSLIKETVAQLQEELLSWFDVMTPAVHEETNFQKLIGRVNEKLEDLDNREAIQIMTLFSGILTQDEMSNVFNVSRRSAAKASLLYQNEGVFALPPAKQRQGLDEEVFYIIQDFYMDEQNARILPDMKNTVKMLLRGVEIEVAKRILLMSTEELHAAFLKKYPEIKVSYSKFAKIRPECCILLGDAKREVCVCPYHDNLEMLYEAIGIRNYNEYLELLVCDKDSKECMFRRCNECIDKSHIFIETIDDYLKTNQPLLQEHGINFKRWCNTNRATQVLNHLQYGDFIDHLHKVSIDTLKHHLTYKAQAEEFKEAKGNVTETSAVVQCDFAENYSTTYFKETQALHFGKTQTTVLPFMVYTRINGEVVPHSVVVVSDALEHVTNTFYTFQHTMIESWMKKNLPRVQEIKYFTDGAASHFKNRKNLTNLYYHEKDHGIRASHHFYASCHGKGACDGVGGTAKAKARRASLAGELINTPLQFFEYIKKNVKLDEVLYVSKDDIEDCVTKMDLELRYAEAKKLPHIRQVHKVQVDGGGTGLQLFELSRDTVPCSVVKIIEAKEHPVHQFNCDDLECSEWVAALYDNQWYYGRVEGILTEDEELLIQFLVGKGSDKLNFTSFEDYPLNVPWRRVLTKVKAPKMNRGERVFTFDESTQKHVTILFNSRHVDSN